MTARLTTPVVIAHRGASGYAPEHTFAAWDLALAQGADYLEQDLQVTADGVLVVMHDETVDRTITRAGAPCGGPVSELTLADLRACEAGAWFNVANPRLARPEYSLQRVPTLDEVLARYHGRAAFYIETKHPEAASGMEEALLTLLRAYRLVEPARLEWRVLVQSFSEASLRKLAALEPGLPLIQLLEDYETEATVLAALERSAEYAVGIGPHYALATERVIAAAHEHCLVVHPYTVNDPADQARLLAAGVDGLFTDFPDVLVNGRPAGEPRGTAAGAAAAGAYARCVSEGIRRRGRRRSTDG